MRNLIGETALSFALIYSVSSRYVDNWYIIEDLALPADLCNQTRILESFKDLLSEEDRKEWRVLDHSDIMSKLS